MSERKYRQRGYQDEAKPARQEKPKGEPTPREFRTPNVPGFKHTIRCTRCGNVLSAEVAHDSRCNRCGVDLWACIHPTVRVERETGSTAPTDARKAFDDLFKF